MLINFNAPIIDIEGEQAQEPVLNNERQPTYRVVEVEDCDTLLDAQARGLNAWEDPRDHKIKARELETRKIDFGRIAVAALVREWPDEKLDSDTAFERWEMALRIKEACRAGDGTLELTQKERMLIRGATDHWNDQNGIRLYFIRARELLDTEHEPSPVPSN